MKIPGEGGGGGLTVERKAEIIQDAMYRTQPKIADFKGAPGYEDKFLAADQAELDRKLETIKEGDDKSEASSDRYAKQIEPVLTYILSGPSFLPRGFNTFAHLATEFDDKCRGTDVVFGVDSQDGNGYSAYSIDTTTDTSPRALQGKFTESAKSHRHIGRSTPAWAASIEYCCQGKAMFPEPYAPHFVLGLDPANVDKAVDKIQFKGEVISGREPDANTDFKLLSEMREQIEMQLKFLQNHPGEPESKHRIGELKKIQRPVNMRLCAILGVKGDSSREVFDDFLKKYPEAMQRAKKSDMVYSNIINCAIRERNLITGRKVATAARAR